MSTLTALPPLDAPPLVLDGVTTLAMWFFAVRAREALDGEQRPLQCSSRQAT
jgi:hypothetical protein